jgi:dihydrolipoamide dehydrogenase
MSYDVIVIGSGPGGYSAAIRAGQYGLNTALIEKDPKLGGTCLHVGCIPTKALLHTAEVWEHFKHPEAQGLHCDNATLDLPLVMKRKDGIVSKHASGVEFLVKRQKVDIIKGFATLKGRGQVEVSSAEGTRTIEAKNIIIATGSEARMLPGMTPDPQFILSNVEILKLQSAPKKLLIIGSGAVGSEFGCIFKSFGSEVVIFEMLPRVVPVEDEEVSKQLERSFKKQGIRCETNAQVDLGSVERTGSGIRMNVKLGNGKTETFEGDCLLVAIGRKPNTENIGLENTKVELDRGFVKVNGFQQTAEPGVYAIGDIVAGTPQLAHVATMEGMIAVGHIAGKPVTPINKRQIPSATYTDPGIGSVGLTEKQAREAGYDVKVGKFPYAGNSKASILGNHDGFVKIVSDAKYGEILGVHIIGPHAYETIAEAVTAMSAEATVDSMIATIHAHPTLYEAVGEAFNSVYGLSINA